MSTDLERQSLGAEAQRTAIERWSSSSGVPVVAWHTEQVSGGAPLARRPVLLAALADVGARAAAHLVVARLDRYSREPLTAALATSELERRGATLECAEGGGGGDDDAAALMRTVLVAVAKFEAAMIRARIRAALAAKRARGEMTGAARYGERLAADGVHVEIEPGEHAVVVRILALHAGGRSVRAIAAELAAAGVAGRAGRALGPTSIQRVITRARPAAERSA